MDEGCEWDEFRPISILSKGIRDYFVGDALLLKQDLLAHKLRIILIPAPEQKHCGHKIRAVETENPAWYSNLYSQIPYFRRDRSLCALERIVLKEDKAFTDINCGVVRYKYHYDSVYRKLIFERLTKGFIHEGHRVGAQPEVCSYFGLRKIENEVEEIPF